jgi:ribosomal protein S18 acetylase RimI-like enzyme
MIEFRPASNAELPELKRFIFEHGPNPWNHLPEIGVDEELSLVACNSGCAMIATDAQQLVGFAIFYYPQALPEKYQKYTQSQQAIYIAEVVVHRDYTGRGIGQRLLSLIVTQASNAGAAVCLIDRHEENLASAGMMRKAGFVELETYLDLERRDYGSRKTTVMGYQLNPD